STINMKPSKRFQEILEAISSYTESLGMPILTPRLKINYRMAFTAIAVSTYAVFSILWIIEKSKESWIECFKSSMMMGGLCSGGAEVITIMLKQPGIWCLIHDTRLVFEDYEKRGSNFVDTLNAGIDRLLYISKWIRNGYLVSFTLMCSLPLIFIAYNGSRITVIQYEIPGIPLDTNAGFLFTNLFQTASMIIAGVGFYAGDMIGIIALTQIITFADILVIKANQMNEVLALKAEAREAALVLAPYDKDDEVQRQLVDTIKWHQLFTEYCELVDNTYHILITGQVLASAFSMLLTFCVNLSEFDLIGAIFFLVSTYKMLLFCLVGTTIEYAYDRVYESICSISWDEMNATQRKMFAMMLKKAQTSETIMMLGILPLSVRTALQ
ncbi:hypothetical protein KR044_009877, partial [Drosophila immigrans]